ncbi:MAG TPA: hypothetical protein VGF40_18355 [Thermoanaerobaculia bacterium]
MIRRSLAILIAITALLVGAAGAWVAVSVPRDVRAEALLKDARAKIQKGEREAARNSLQEIAKSYPRTDAAAAASYALFQMAEQDAAELRARLESLDQSRSAQEKRTAAVRKAQEAERPQVEADRLRIAELETKVAELEKKLAAVEKASRVKAAPSRKAPARKRR